MGSEILGGEKRNADNFFIFKSRKLYNVYKKINIRILNLHQFIILFLF